MITTLVDALTQSARCHPENIAFRCNDQQLSYAELAQKARQLANHLIESGVRPGDRVAVYMPRCVESGIAIYGILTAGAAFVPIDPAAPAASIASLLNDCGITVLTTVPAMRRLVSQLNRQPHPLDEIIGLDTPVSEAIACPDWPKVFEGSDAPVSQRINSDALAYIIHTSGSTGKPKGIMHTHFSGLSYARLSQHAYQITSQDIIGSHAPLHTDMSTLGFLTAPLAGATTVIVPDSHTRMPASLCELVERERLTIWYSVPLALVQMLATGKLDKLDLLSLRWLLYGGEPFSLKHIQALREALPRAAISNVYGPAEVNQCTHYDLPANDEITQSPVCDATLPIGRPWPETMALIVNDDDQPVQPGEPGELLISSSTMMTGYWNRPELNERAFLRFDDGAGERQYYRTGDLVRADPDGLLWLAGRKDRQVKIRGFRVELDHVELSLTSHPGVAEAGVVAVFDPAQNTSFLVAAVIATDAGLTPDTIIAFARKLLTEAATPQTVIMVDTLPRTTSGKIDRRQLLEQWQTSQDP